MLKSCNLSLFQYHQFCFMLVEESLLACEKGVEHNEKIITT